MQRRQKMKAVCDVKQYTEDSKQVDLVNITSFNFNSVRSVILGRLDTSNTQNSVEISFKIQTVMATIHHTVYSKLCSLGHQGNKWN